MKRQNLEKILILLFRSEWFHSEDTLLGQITPSPEGPELPKNTGSHQVQELFPNTWIQL